MKQMYMWRDVERILQCKMKCAEQGGKIIGGGMMGGALGMGEGIMDHNAYYSENRLEL